MPKADTKPNSEAAHADTHPHPKPQSEHNALNLPERKGTAKKVVILVLVALLLIGGCAGMWYWQNQQIKQQKQNTETQLSDLNKKIEQLQVDLAAVPKDETKDWLTYTDKYEGLSFKYPKDWKLTTQDRAKDFKDYDPSWKGPYIVAKLTSPKGFVLSYDTHISGIGGGCDPETCPVNTLIDSQKILTLKNGVSVFIVKYQIKSEDGIVRKIGLIGQKDGKPEIKSYKGFPPYLLFETTGSDSSATSFAGPGGFSDNPGNINYRPDLTAEQYFALPDLVTAQMILQTTK